MKSIYLSGVLTAPLPLAIATTAFWPEFADATNRFERISSGIASDPGKKLGQLKFIGLLAGGFFAVSAVGLFFAREKLSITAVTPAVMLAFGSILASFWLFS